MDQDKQVQGAFVQADAAKAIREFYKHVDAVGPRYWEQPVDPGARADVDELARMFSVEDPRE